MKYIHVTTPYCCVRLAFCADMFVNRTAYRFPGGSSCASVVEDAPGRPTATVYNGDVHICNGNQRVLNQATGAGDDPVPYEYIYSQGYIMPLYPSITSTNVCKPAQQNEKYVFQISQQPGGNEVYMMRNIDGKNMYEGSGVIRGTAGANEGTFLISSCEKGATPAIGDCKPALPIPTSSVPLYACVIDEGQIACNRFGGMTQYGFNVQKQTSSSVSNSCVPQEGPCTADKDCCDPFACEGGKCVMLVADAGKKCKMPNEECTSNSDCCNSQYTTCASTPFGGPMTCLVTSPGGPCTVDKDCNPPLYCVNGVCGMDAGGQSIQLPMQAMTSNGQTAVMNGQQAAMMNGQPAAGIGRASLMQYQRNVAGWRCR